MKRVDPLVARIGESLSLIGDYGKTTECVHDQESLDYERFIRKLIRSFGARRKLQTHSSVTDRRDRSV